MRKIYIVLFAASIAITAMAKKQPEYQKFPEEASKDVEIAINAMDMGLHDFSIQMLDSLDRVYPGTYIILYETAYAHYLKKDYKSAVKKMLKIVDHPDADETLYVMIGSSYDDMGDTKKALEYYDKGIKRFPKSGRLYVNKGISYERLGRGEDALDAFVDGINVDPLFKSNYYHAAMVQSETNPAWAAIYAEEFLALDFSDFERRQAMAKLVFDPIFRLKIEGQTVHLHVESPEDLTPKTFIYNLSLSSALKFSLPFDGSDPNQLSAVRKKFVEIMCDNASLESLGAADTDSERLPIIDYLKSIIDAGHWDAYSTYLYNLAVGKDILDNEDSFEKSGCAELFRWLLLGNDFVPAPTTYITQRPLKKD